MEGIGQLSLFRPIPLTSLQQNLAGFYGKTQEFVQERFESIRNEVSETSGRKTNPTTEKSASDSNVAIRPTGVGELLDMYV